ncbi:type II toxin-antitoxin system RelE/ParE family toxin [Treponema pedis]|uniref:Type II toxin-antitoxin system RelE/ParE family toxin n=1 Tax=Treponema pedis TaxID=409322 RepID=A0A7S7AXY2_9SPIR|nr:type II toxin-antitoxin system RelE/ParE family toxin [Treponema pedis]
MIVSFGNFETERIYKGYVSKKYPYAIQNTARKKLRMIAAAYKVEDLKIPPGNRLEKLLGGLKNYWSIRVNDRFRIVFKWTMGGAENVEITDYH